MLRAELESGWSVAAAARDREKSRKLLDLYMRVFDVVEQPTFGGLEPLASIVEVGTEEDRTADFILEDETIVLPAGSYRLRYRSDDSHDYSGWNAMAPLEEFWGIVVYRLPDRE